jgi:hypothetical protein
MLYLCCFVVAVAVAVPAVVTDGFYYFQNFTHKDATVGTANEHRFCDD